ncbi:BSD domain [Fragilaria crotonensis]|nr:BSD domain [Fragilaria crotonensis]
MFSSLRKPAANTEVSIRKARKSTYTEPLRDKSKEYTAEELDDLKVYLSDFYRTIYSRRDECTKICQQNPKTVGHFFETLVPRHVTFEDFWQRYFYRCDPDNVIREWDRQAAAQKEQLDRKIQGSVHSAQKLWTRTVGGAKKEPEDGQQPDGSSEENAADAVEADPFNPDTFMKDRAEALNVLQSTFGDSPQRGQTQQEMVTDLPDEASDALLLSEPVGLSSEGGLTRGEVTVSDAALLREGNEESESVPPSPQVDVGQALPLGFSRQMELSQPEIGAVDTTNDVKVTIEGQEDVTEPLSESSYTRAIITTSLEEKDAPTTADSIPDVRERTGRKLSWSC